MILLIFIVFFHQLIFFRERVEGMEERGERKTKRERQREGRVRERGREREGERI